MGEFIANVKAVLDLGGIPAQVRQIESTPVTLSNVQISPSSLNNIRTQIQNTLNSGNFSLNLNSRTMQRQYRQMGNDACDNYLDAFNRSIRRRTSIPDDVISNMRNNLIDRYGLSDQDMARVTRHLDDMNLRITRIRTAFDDNKNLRMSVRGVDQYGEMVDLVTTYNRETNQLTSQRTTVTQTFDQDATAIRQFNTALEAARDALGSNGIGSTIGKLNERFTKLGSTGHAMLSGVGQDLDELRRIHSNMASTQSDNDLVDYYDRFNRIAERARNNLSIISSETSPLQEFERTLSRARDSLADNSIDATTARLAKQLRGLNTTDASAFESIQNDIGILERLGREMRSMDGDALVSHFEQYEQVARRVRNSMDAVSNANSKMLTDTDILARKNKMADWLDKNSRAAKKYGQTIKDLCDRYDQIDVTSDNAIAQAKSIDDAWNGVIQKAKAEGLTGKSIFDQVKDFGKKALGFISVGEVIDTAIRGFREMYQAVYDIDTAMTNLKKVTNESEATYDSFLTRSADSAQRLGRTVSSLVEQTANWSKLGYSLPEAERLSELSSIYANVAEVSDATAVSDIVTAMKAFGLTTNEAVNIVDSLNDLGNKFATDAASLGQGLSNSASAMKLAGSDLYETLAMITGITEITQDASGAGNALKISSMRIRGKRSNMPTYYESNKLQTSIKYAA